MDDLGDRTKRFALMIIRLCASLPKSSKEGRMINRQILRSGTSPGAQYREARRGRSRAEFISKMTSALQELDETAYWLELLVAAEVVPFSRTKEVQKEVNELIAIFVSSIKTARGGDEDAQ